MGDSMKGFFYSAALSLALVQGCERSVRNETNMTTVQFGGYYQLQIETQALIGATIASADGPLIKFADQKWIAGSIVDRELESLPQAFDLSSYPRILFQMVPSTHLPEEDQQRFRRSAASFRIGEPDTQISEHSGKSFTVVSACQKLSCTSFVIQANQNEQLLMLVSEGFDPIELSNLAGGL